MNNCVSVDKSVVKNLLASRKFSMNKLEGKASIENDKVIFGSFNDLELFSREISIPVKSFFEDFSNDLDDGVTIARKSDAPDATDYRKGSLYYSHHHLAKTSAEPNLMALRCVVHCSKEENIQLHPGHPCKEFIYVTKGRIQVQWQGENGQERNVELDEGDSIFVSSFTPHSYTAIGSDEPAEIIAVNYL